MSAKVCQICEGPLPPRKRSLCGAEECAKERSRRSVRAAIEKYERETGESWHSRYREQRNEANRRYDWRAKNPDRAAYYDAARRARKKGAEIGEPFTNEEIFVRDGWICGLCREPIDPDLDYPDRRSASLDHVVPLSKGGAHSRENVQASHLSCNVAKGDRAS